MMDACLHCLRDPYGFFNLPGEGVPMPGYQLHDVGGGFGVPLVVGAGVPPEGAGLVLPMVVVDMFSATHP